MNLPTPATLKKIDPRSDSALDCLIERLFDYAGMFPPAQRDFESALRESASCNSSLRRPWLLASNLVLDTAHSQKLSETDLSVYGFNSPLSVCVLATAPFETVKSVLTSLSKTSSPIEISSLEVKTLGKPSRAIIAEWGELASQFRAMLAIEPDLSQENWSAELDSCIEGISKASQRVALKCRLTGPTGIGAEKLAVALCKACDTRSHFKVTGGLHHPVVDPSSHSYPMGFVAVAAAVMLRRVLGAAISESSIAQLLTNSSHERFSYGRNLRFDNHQISIEQLIAAKKSAHFSIGSCSLHEPDHDLIAFAETTGQSPA